MHFWVGHKKGYFPQFKTSCCLISFPYDFPHFSLLWAQSASLSVKLYNVFVVWEEGAVIYELDVKYSSIYNIVCMHGRFGFLPLLTVLCIREWCFRSWPFWRCWFAQAVCLHKVIFYVIFRRKEARVNLFAPACSFSSVQLHTTPLPTTQQVPLVSHLELNFVWKCILLLDTLPPLAFATTGGVQIAPVLGGVGLARSQSGSGWTSAATATYGKGLQGQDRASMNKIAIR